MGSQGRGSPWACAILQCGAGGEAAGLGAPDLCQHALLSFLRAQTLHPQA